MKVVFELGRILRDRRIRPIKVWLFFIFYCCQLLIVPQIIRSTPCEVIFILREQKSLNEIWTMERYILEELSVFSSWPSTRTILESVYVQSLITASKHDSVIDCRSNNLQYPLPEGIDILHEQECHRQE